MAGTVLQKSFRDMVRTPDQNHNKRPVTIALLISVDRYDGFYVINVTLLLWILMQ